jgi:hypothetical protein
VSADPRVGTEIAGYRIERPLGRGGMSIVYLAEHLRLRRKVAFKILSPELSNDEAFRTRFIRESEAAASLDHPNIIPIFEAGEADDALFIAMRYVKTTDLAALLGERGRLDLPHTVSIVEQTASALDAAHSEGLVHRDVKPANLLVAVGAGPGGTDHVYLSDFGLTKRTATQSGLTRTGSFMGTLDYVPPEQIKGQDLDGRSDQYALACVLYQCLTGHVPFDRQDEAAVLYAHLSEPPPTVTATRQDLPVEIDAVVVRGMAKEPADRFSTCGDLANAVRAAAGMAERTVTLPGAELAAAVAGATVDPTRVAPPPTAAADPPRVPPSAPPAVPPPAPVQEPKAPVPSRGRNRTGLIAAAVAAIVLIGIGLLLLPRRGGEEEAPSPSASAVAEPSSEPSPTEEPSPEPSPTEEPSPEPPPVNPLVGRWVGTDADGSTNRLTIRRDGSLRLTDDNALACSPDGFIVIDDVGEFRKRQGRDQLILRDAFADCQQGSGDLTIPELIIEHDPVTDTVRSVNEPPPGTIFRRV